MRTATFIAALAAAFLTLGTAGVALAEHHAGQPPSDFVQKDNGASLEHHRRGEVNDYGASTKVPEKPFPWKALALGAILAALSAPVALLVYRSTSKDLSDLKTVGRVTDGKEKSGEAKKQPVEVSKGDALGGGSPRDRVWEAVTSVNQWVPVDWVARTAGLSASEATDELNALAEEGQLEHANDKSGKPIYRAV
ncbi:MAG: hypothetical protein JST54_03930 [Deltaproteobacteria bacterium]|nr:hypothetical protein [Deltaproteobacteria bacterium]